MEEILFIYHYKGHLKQYRGTYTNKILSEKGPLVMGQNAPYSRERLIHLLPAVLTRNLMVQMTSAQAVTYS